MTFPHTATISRLQVSGAKQMYVDAGTVECFLQPIDSTSVQLYGMVFGKAYNCYMPSTSDVSESDELTIDGTRYGVRGIRHHNYGSLNHKVAAVQKI